MDKQITNQFLCNFEEFRFQAKLGKTQFARNRRNGTAMKTNIQI